MRKMSVRYRLLAIALLPTLVIFPILLGATMWRWNAKFDGALISKVRSDLTVAHQYFSRILENNGEQMKALGESVALQSAVESGDRHRLLRLLQERREALQLDFLYVADIDGRVLSFAGGKGPSSIDVLMPVFANAVVGRASAVVDIFSPEELQSISPELAQRASIDLIPTTNAAPSNATKSLSGMVVHAADRTSLADGRQILVVSGTLLNRNLRFIDTINDLVYQAGSLPEGSEGTATLFQDDVRISTNVRLFEGKRALGTRVSSQVRKSVLGDGNIWLDRAFVVNDWYISAYEPIVDSRGKRVGMLYVGFLEAPFRRTKFLTISLVALAFVAVAGFTIPLFMRWAGTIFRPLEKMSNTINLVENGDLEARTGIRDHGDEIEQVAGHLDILLDRVQERDQQLREWNEQLNRRVEDRTAELREANSRLEAATKQLVMSEKLAAIGEITAGIAHEINNPIAVISGNLEVLRVAMGEKANEGATEFRLIDEQTERMRQIVSKLLQFARPEEYSGNDAFSVPTEVFSDCLPLVRHLISKNDIQVRREQTSTRAVKISRTELQQVLVNLMVNAVHAMPNGGRLSLACVNAERDGEDGVTITVGDSGTGMSPEVARRIFDPFYTTKRGTGTGLGLSITHMLVTNAGGQISVDTSPGKGTRFRIWLPEYPL